MARIVVKNGHQKTCLALYHALCSKYRLMVLGSTMNTTQRTYVSGWGHVISSILILVVSASQTLIMNFEMTNMHNLQLDETQS
jgi:hypothetical protein